MLVCLDQLSLAQILVNEHENGNKLIATTSEASAQNAGKQIDDPIICKEEESKENQHSNLNTEETVKEKESVSKAEVEPLSASAIHEILRKSDLKDPVSELEFQIQVFVTQTHQSIPSNAKHATSKANTKKSTWTCRCHSRLNQGMR